MLYKCKKKRGWINLIFVSLFVNEELISSMIRGAVPSIGDFIIIDCGDMVKVVEVSHQWDDPSTVQINCVEVKGKLENDKNNKNGC